MARRKHSPSTRTEAPRATSSSSAPSSPKKDIWLQIESWVEREKKKVLYGVGLVVVLVLAYVGYRQLYLRPRAEEAAELFMYPERYLLMDSLELALEGDGTNPGFRYIAEEYDGTGPGEVAQYYTGRILLELGRAEEAIPYLEDADLSREGKYLEQLRYLLLGDAYAEAGDYEQARSYYEEAVSFDNELVTPFALWKTALFLEYQGDLEGARVLWERLLREYPQSVHGQQAPKYLARIQAKLGESVVSIP